MFVNRRMKSNISKVSRVWGGGGRVHIITSLALPEDVSGGVVEGGGSRNIHVRAFTRRWLNGSQAKRSANLYNNLRVNFFGNMEIGDHLVTSWPGDQCTSPDPQETLEISLWSLARSRSHVFFKLVVNVLFDNEQVKFVRREKPKPFWSASVTHFALQLTRPSSG